MADDTALRQEIHEALSNRLGRVLTSAEVTAGVDSLLPIVEARCRRLEAERNTAIQQGREQAAQAIEAARAARPNHRDEHVWEKGYRAGLRDAAASARRGLPVPETNQEPQT